MRGSFIVYWEACARVLECAYREQEEKVAIWDI